MGILLCEFFFRDVWIRNKSVRAEIGQILHTDTHPHTHAHTHTTAAKLVVRLAALSSHFRLQNLTKISPCVPNSTAITACIFLRLHLTNPLPLDRSLFAFVLCFYDNKSSKKQKCGMYVCVPSQTQGVQWYGGIASIGVNYEVLSANDRRNL